MKPPSAPKILTPGVIAANAAARRLQSRLALAVLVIPALGTIAAIALALHRRHVETVTLVVLFGMYVVTAIGIEVGFHRVFSHRVLTSGPAVRVFLAIAGSMAAQGPVLFWAAVHRRHHAFTDKPGDPHSPHFRGEERLGMLEGLWHAHIGWLFTEEITDFSRYTPDLLRDPIVFAVSRFYLVWLGAGLLVPAAVGGLVTMSWMGALEGLLWGGLLRVCVGHHFTWCVNSFGHVFGHQAFEDRDRSMNNAAMAIISFGGSWHNNHHAFPSSATTALHWWQIDLAGLFIKLLAAVGLAWNVKGHSDGALQMRSASAARSSTWA